FDFAHPSALTAQDIAAVEAEVNAHIRHNQPVTTRLMTPDDAIAAGAMALFGEKYGDEVRVLSMGLPSPATAGEGDSARAERGEGSSYSVELCGGTHVAALGDIALFKIVSESAVASGVRRIEALTGETARQWLLARDERLRETAASLKAAPDEVPARVAALIEERRKLERELAEAKKALAMGRGGAKAEARGAEQVAGYSFLGQIVDGLDSRTLRSEIDAIKQRLGSGIAALIAINEGRASVAVGVTDDLAGQLSAVDLVKAAVAALGGEGGGGRPDMAQGGGPEGSKAPNALAAIRSALATVPA
ncbi:MAG: DHHA1 domain-containing protein, partial [Sphingomonadales bacterium]|nr:DHHA1 domain-containing protein [Sphingomonadales bacterium]